MIISTFNIVRCIRVAYFFLPLNFLSNPPFYSSTVIQIDAESMEEMQGMQEDMQMPSFEMPDISATLAKFSTGGSSGSSSPQVTSGKKRQ